MGKSKNYSVINLSGLLVILSEKLHHWFFWGNCQIIFGVGIGGLVAWFKDKAEKVLGLKSLQIWIQRPVLVGVSLRGCLLFRARTALFCEPLSMGNSLVELLRSDVNESFGIIVLLSTGPLYFHNHISLSHRWLSNKFCSSAELAQWLCRAS